MRLVRELLAADAEPDLANADAAARARRFLTVAHAALGIPGTALLLRDAATGELGCVAAEFPERARALLAPPPGVAGYALARRACEERRAFLVRRTSDDALLAALREADPAIESLAIVPLADREPVGALLLAGDESALSAETIRALNPALRLLGLLLAPGRDASHLGHDGPTLARLRADLHAEQERSEQYAAEVAALRAHVAELERAWQARAEPSPMPSRIAVSLEATAVETAREVEDLVATLVSAPAPGESTPPVSVPGVLAPAVSAPEVPEDPVVVLIDAASAWSGLELRGHRLEVVGPGSELADRVRDVSPARIVVNLAMARALDALVGVRQAGVFAPAWGILRAAEADRVLGLALVEAVGHPPTPDAIAAAVERQAGRGTRVFAAGRDADALMKMRQALARQGLSVSMARDAKQANDLIAMVKPQVLVLDLALPLRDGYELVMRAAALDPVPGIVLILAEADPAAIFGDKLRERRNDERSVGAKQWLSALLAQKVPHHGARKAQAGMPAR